MSRRSQIAANPGLQATTPQAENPAPPPVVNPTVDGVSSPRRRHFFKANGVAGQETPNNRRIRELEQELSTLRGHERQKQEERDHEEREQREDLEGRSHRGREEHAGWEVEPSELGGERSGGPGRQSGSNDGQQRQSQAAEGGQELLACPHCGQACKNKAGLSAHVRYKHK